jgi:hypothetical protein
MLLTAKSMKDVIDLARARRVIGGDLTGIELVRDDAAYAAAHIVGNGNGHAKAEKVVDDGSPLSTPEPATAGNGLAHRYQPIEVVVEETDDASTRAPGDVGAEPLKVPEPEVLEVSEADIARIAPRVMTHRLRVRDGPQDEILGSARFPAVLADDHDDGRASAGAIGRSTIKEILVRILAEV